jgi:hypothetical protein
MRLEESEWNNKSTEVGIIAGRRPDNVSKWITYFIPATLGVAKYRMEHVVEEPLAMSERARLRELE